MPDTWSNQDSGDTFMELIESVGAKRAGEIAWEVEMGLEPVDA